MPKCLRLTVSMALIRGPLPPLCDGICHAKPVDNDLDRPEMEAETAGQLI
jgi:hypothetical protein